MSDLEPWVVEIIEATTFAEVNAAQASWSRAVTRFRCDPIALAELAAITSIGRARWEELADQLRTLTDDRMERFRRWSLP